MSHTKKTLLTIWAGRRRTAIILWSVLDQGLMGLNESSGQTTGCPQSFPKIWVWQHWTVRAQVNCAYLWCGWGARWRCLCKGGDCSWEGRCHNHFKWCSCMWSLTKLGEGRNLRHTYIFVNDDLTPNRDKITSVFRKRKVLVMFLLLIRKLLSLCRTTKWLF